MKKLLLISAFAVVTTLSSYGQGSVTFANTSATRVWFQQVAGGSTTYMPVGSAYTAELVFATDGSTTDFAQRASRLGATTTFGPVAGLFSGGGRTATAISPAGGFGLFQVRVWDTATGGDAYYGESGILRVDTGDTTSTPPGTAGSLVGAGLTSFVVTVVPEPSVIGLGILGAGALLMLRRRK